MFCGCTVSYLLRSGETAELDDDDGRRDDGRRDEGCHDEGCYDEGYQGKSDHVDGDGGARGFHLCFCQTHQTMCTYNTRTQGYNY